MKNLLKYVKENFKTPANIVEHFKNKFAINVKVEKLVRGEYYLFKYSVDTDFHEYIALECRGQILCYSNGQWKIASRPFDKFFNIGEELCQISKETDLSKYRLIEKLDGTCIQVWFDPINYGFRISTLGTITTKEVGEWNCTFKELFLETLGIDYNTFNATLKKLVYDATLIFELCTDRNHILTTYKNNKVSLLGIRSINTDNYVPQSLLIDFINAFREHTKAKISLPLVFDIDKYKNYDDVKNKLSEITSNDIYGEIPEGAVIYKDNVPIAKLKLDEYLNYKRFSDFDFNCSKNSVLKVFFDNKLDDYSHVFTPRLKKYADALIYEKNHVMHKIHNVLDMTSKKYTNQKYFAMDVFEFCTGFGIPEFTDFFFQNRKCGIDFWEWCTLNNNQKNKIIKKFKKRLENKNDKNKTI